MRQVSSSGIHRGSYRRKCADNEPHGVLLRGLGGNVLLKIGAFEDVQTVGLLFVQGSEEVFKKPPIKLEYWVLDQPGRGARPSAASAEGCWVMIEEMPTPQP